MIETLAAIALIAVGGLLLHRSITLPRRVEPPLRASVQHAATPSATDGVVFVRVLGPVEIHGLATPCRAAKVVELVAFLATHPGGVTDGQIKAALWMDRPVAGGTFNNTVSLARRTLGNTPDGRPYLPPVEQGRYRLDPTLVTDFDRLVSASDERQSALLKEVAGPPFHASAGFEWAFSEGLVDNAATTVAAIAVRVATALIADGDVERAEGVVRCGLRVVPGDGRLYDCLARSRQSRGDTAGVARILTEQDRALSA